ncbi:MAG: hypothetical protein H5T46_03070, partial [Archaeoglobi archaeon]|nr:hypothetical protein [Candidatus Mnemosynella sp.]
MERMKIFISLLILALASFVALLLNFFGLFGLIRIALGLIFLASALLFLLFTGILVYARSTFSIIALAALFLSLYALREVYLSRILNAIIVLLIFGASLIFALWWIS